MALRMSLRRRMILLAGACILPSVLLLAGTQWQLRLSREAEIRQEIGELARSEASEIGTIIAGARQFLAALQRTPAIMDHNAPLCSAWLARLRQDDPGYASIRADDLSGRAFCSSDPGRASFEGGSARFRAALADRGFAVGSYNLSPLTRRPELPLAHILTDDDGTPSGVLVVGLDLGWLGRDLAARLPPDASLTVLDRGGAVLLRVNGKDVAASSARNAPASSASDADDWIMGRAAVGASGLRVIAMRPKQAAFAALDRTTRDGAVLIGLALLLACLVAAWIGRRFIHAPIAALLVTTERLRAGDFAARSGLASGHSELAVLGTRLNALAEVLQHREQAQADAEAKLRQFAATLEQRVAERTRALAEANQRVAEEAEQRQRSQAELAQVQKLDAIGKLTGGIAHDFNNLLAAVLGSLELALKRVQEPRLHRLLTVAMQAAQRGAELTAHLLAFSRKQDLALQPVDVNGIIAGMRDLLSRTIGTRVRLHDDLAGELWPAVADPVQLEMALLNLAINARDAMPDGGTLAFRTRNVHVAEGPPAGATLSPGDYAMVTVTDSGEGMPPDVQAKAFEPFFTTKGPGKGTGLGLSMVYGFARQAGGTVTIDSTFGNGTAISLYLPRAATAPVAETLPEAADAAASTLRVLLVDDDPMVRETTREMLRALGHVVTDTADPAAALQSVREQPAFDLLVADFAMPGMTGVQLAVQARAVRPNLPVLIVTGYADAGALGATSEQGWPVLRKPFPPRALADAVRAATAAAPGHGSAAFNRSPPGAD